MIKLSNDSRLPGAPEAEVRDRVGRSEAQVGGERTSVRANVPRRPTSQRAAGPIRARINLTD